MNSRKIFVFLLFLLNLTLANAQTVQNEKHALSKILNTLEDRYNIRFSYVDDIVKDIRIAIPEENLSLEDIIDLISAETDLSFEILDNRFIVITKKKNENEDSYSTQRLDEVVVVNYLTTGLSKLNDGSISIKPETFGILPGLIEPDVLQTIQALPGIMSIDETVSNINVRGGTHDQNLIMWEGIKMYQAGHFFGLISAFNPYTTKSVHVSKNGTSAKYGDGISSIIDMRLSDAIDNIFKAGGGFNLINGDAFVKVPTSRRTELQLSARRSITDLVNTPTYDQYFKRVFEDSDFNQKSESSLSNNESFFFYDVSVKFLYDITPKDKIRIQFLNSKNILDYEERSTVNERSEALNSNLSQKNLASGISYSRNWSNRLTSKASFYLSSYDLDATNFDILNNQRLVQENKVTDGSIRLDLTFASLANFKFDTGYQFTETGIGNLEDVNNPAFRSYIKEVLRSHAIYGETKFLSNNAKTRLNLGTRINHISKFDKTLIEPRFSFSQRFMNNFRLEILGELKSQTTSQIIDLQNDFLGIEKRRWVLANNRSETTTINNVDIYPIPVLKSKQASVGVHYNKNKFLASVEGFLKQVDGITSRSQGFQNQFQFINDTGNYEVRGLDILINKQFQDYVSTWFSYSLSRNEYNFENLNNGNSFPNISDIRHAITFGSAYTYNNLKLAIGLNWYSGRPYTGYIGVEDNTTERKIIYEAPNSSNLSDYLRLDSSASYTFNLGNAKASIGASLWNMLDRKNVLNIYYNLEDDNSITTVENQSLGVTPNMNFRVNF